MNPFSYQKNETPEQATHAITARGTKFLGGGTNFVDLMKYGVARPTTAIDITKLDFAKVQSGVNGGVMVGALVRNSNLANKPRIVRGYPLLSQALLPCASPQLRNMATTGETCCSGHAATISWVRPTPRAISARRDQDVRRSRGSTVSTQSLGKRTKE